MYCTNFWNDKLFASIFACTVCKYLQISVTAADKIQVNIQHVHMLLLYRKGIPATIKLILMLHNLWVTINIWSWRTQARVQDLRLSQWCCWAFRAFGIWWCVVGPMVHNALKASDPSKCGNYSPNDTASLPTKYKSLWKEGDHKSSSMQTDRKYNSTVCPNTSSYNTIFNLQLVFIGDANMLQWSDLPIFWEQWHFQLCHSHNCELCRVTSWGLV